MIEISCSDKILKALVDCAEKIILSNNANERLLLAQTIETLSASISVLRGNKEKEGDD